MSRRNHRSWTRETSALAHAAKARKRLAGPCPEYPAVIPPGTPLHTIRIESHGPGVGFEVRVYQARRRNQIVVEMFGRRSRPHGVDWLVKHLRRRLLGQGVTSRERGAGSTEPGAGSAERDA